MPGNDDETLQDYTALSMRVLPFPSFNFFSLFIVYFILIIIIRYFLIWSFYYLIIMPIIFY